MDMYCGQKEIGELNAYSPREIKLMMGFDLIDEDIIYHEYGPPREEEDEEFDWHLWHDYAVDGRANYMQEYPDNQFRFTSKIMRQGNAFIFYTEQTSAGQHAARCYKEDQCCDAQTGHLNREATLIYWLNKGNDALQVRPWHSEIWATQIERKVMWTNRGFRTIRGTATPDIPATRDMWNARFTLAARNPESLRRARNTWFPKTEKWASVMQQELMEVVLRT